MIINFTLVRKFYLHTYLFKIYTYKLQHRKYIGAKLVRGEKTGSSTLGSDMNEFDVK